jgi:NADPH:quinone reductase-like Zn-dependent oxidoreductase
MKAVVLLGVGEADNLIIQEVADPQAGAGEVVVRVRAAALNHRDVFIRRGLYPGIKFPVILGSDGAGDVVAVGPGGDPALIGQAVVLNPCFDWGSNERAQSSKFNILGLPKDGTYAELINVPVANLAAKPEHLSYEEAAAIPLAGLTAYRSVVTRAQVQAGEKVLVTGIGGGVSAFALQFAAQVGAEVYVTSGSDEKLARARELGAAGGVNYHREDWGKELVALTGGGPDVVIDSVGGETFTKAIEILKPGGRLVTYGATTGGASKLEIRRIFWKQLSILGATMGTDREFNEMIKHYAESGLRPVVDHIFDLSEAADAHRRMEEAGQFGKIVLQVK